MFFALMWSLCLSSTAVNTTGRRYSNVHCTVLYSVQFQKCKEYLWLVPALLLLRDDDAPSARESERDGEGDPQHIFAVFELARLDAVGGHLAILRYYHYKWLPTDYHWRMERGEEKGNFTCEPCTNPGSSLNGGLWIKKTTLFFFFSSSVSSCLSCCCLQMDLKKKNNIP